MRRTTTVSSVLLISLVLTGVSAGWPGSASAEVNELRLWWEKGGAGQFIEYWKSNIDFVDVQGNGIGVEVVRRNKSARVEFYPYDPMMLAVGEYADPWCQWGRGWVLVMQQDLFREDPDSARAVGVSRHQVPTNGLHVAEGRISSALVPWSPGECLAGGFRVHEIEYHGNGKIKRFSADFRYGGGSAHTVMGTIRYGATQPFRPARWKWEMRNNLWPRYTLPIGSADSSGTMLMEIRNSRSDLDPNRERSATEAQAETDLDSLVAAKGGGEPPIADPAETQPAPEDVDVASGGSDPGDSPDDAGNTPAHPAGDPSDPTSVPNAGGDPAENFAAEVESALNDLFGSEGLDAQNASPPDVGDAYESDPPAPVDPVDEVIAENKPAFDEPVDPPETDGVDVPDRVESGEPEFAEAEHPDLDRIANTPDEIETDFASDRPEVSDSESASEALGSSEEVANAADSAADKEWVDNTPQADSIATDDRADELSPKGGEVSATEPAEGSDIPVVSPDAPSLLVGRAVTLGGDARASNGETQTNRGVSRVEAVSEKMPVASTPPTATRSLMASIAVGIRGVRATFFGGGAAPEASKGATADAVLAGSNHALPMATPAVASPGSPPAARSELGWFSQLTNRLIHWLVSFSQWLFGGSGLSA